MGYRTEDRKTTTMLREIEQITNSEPSWRDMDKKLRDTAELMARANFGLHLTPHKLYISYNSHLSRQRRSDLHVFLCAHYLVFWVSVPQYCELHPAKIFSLDMSY